MVRKGERIKHHALVEMEEVLQKTKEAKRPRFPLQTCANLQRAGVFGDVWMYISSQELSE